MLQLLMAASDPQMSDGEPHGEQSDELNFGCGCAVAQSCHNLFVQAVGTKRTLAIIILFQSVAVKGIHNLPFVATEACHQIILAINVHMHSLRCMFEMCPRFRDAKEDVNKVAS